MLVITRGYSSSKARKSPAFSMFSPVLERECRDSSIESARCHSAATRLIFLAHFLGGFNIFQPISHPNETRDPINIQPLMQQKFRSLPSFSTSNPSQIIASPCHPIRSRRGRASLLSSVRLHFRINWPWLAVMKFVENPQASPNWKTSVRSVPLFFFLPYEGPIKLLSEKTRPWKGFLSNHQGNFGNFLRSSFMLQCYVILIFEHVSQFISVLRCYQFLDFIFFYILTNAPCTSCAVHCQPHKQPPFSGDSR